MSTILHDTAWPQSLVKLITDFHGDEEGMQGPYNTLLAYCFPALRNYVVAPFPRGITRYGASEFDVFYLFTSLMVKRPVMYVEVENDSALLESVEARALADQRVRQRFDELAPKCCNPTFYGISIIGVKIRTYRIDVATLEIAAIQEDWSMDIRTQAAFDEVKKMVADIAGALESQKAQ